MEDKSTAMGAIGMDLPMMRLIRTGSMKGVRPAISTFEEMRSRSEQCSDARNRVARADERLVEKKAEYQENKK